MSVQAKLTELDRAVCDLEDAGFTVPAIARKLKIDRLDVRRALERSGRNRPDASGIAIEKPRVAPGPAAGMRPGYDLTSAIMGDPLPGRSALDRRGDA